MDHQAQQNNRSGHSRSLSKHKKDHLTKPKNIKVYYANVDNSLASKYDELLLTLSKSHYDVVALTEIKPKNGQMPALTVLNIPGFNLCTSDLETDKTRGVAIYVRDSLQSRIIQPTLQSPFHDSVWISIKGRSQTSLLLGCVYRSGSPNIAIPRDNSLHEMLIWAAEQSGYTHKLVVGDFNHPGLTWLPFPGVPESTAPNHPDRKFLECVHETFFHQHITNPTRFRDKQSPTLDDLIFTNEIGMVEQIAYLDPLGASDHIAIAFTLIFSTDQIPSTKTSYMFDKANYDQMRTMMTKDWNALLQDLSTQEAFDTVEAAITEAMKTHIPTRTAPSNQNRSKPLWMNAAALRKARRKHSAWIRYQNTKQGEDFREYQKMRNEASHEARQARRSFEMNLAAESKVNNKAFWKYVNSRRKTTSNVADLEKSDGIFATTDQDKADTLNSQYVKTFTEEDLSNLPTFKTKNVTTEPLEDIRFSEGMVLKKLKALRVDKSPGPDGLHPRVLKELAEQLALPLSLVFTKSVKEGYLPYQWKRANVCPIFKKGNRSDPANYRPVSLTSIVCKIMERIISESIMEHTKANDLQCPQQHGFTSGKSTVTNLLEATNIWTEALGHQAPVDIIYLDYAKAFDTVPHERLCRQVETFGIRGHVLHWIRSFLTGRVQRVAVNGQYSSWREVTSGVPQGSVLGPLLFTLFVSDIPSIVDNFCSLFADDTKLFTAMYDENYDRYTSSLQTDLNQLQRWTEEMQMRLHPDKCKVMHLGKNNPRTEYTLLKSDGTVHPLSTTAAEKDLGVTIDEELKYSKHIQTQINKANRTIGALKQSYKYMDKTSFLMLYKSLIRPHLEYASPVWSARTKHDQDALESVQRRATRLVPSLSGLDYSKRLKELKLPTLSYRRQRADAIQIFKITHDIDNVASGYTCPVCNQKALQPSLAPNTRGHPHKLQIQHSNGPRRQHLTVRALENWNGLSEDTVCSRTVNAFKAGIARDWKEKPDLYEYRFTY